MAAKKIINLISVLTIWWCPWVESSLVPEAPGHSQERLGQSLVGSLLPSPGTYCAQAFVCALQESVSPVLCKIWWLYGGVNGDILQEGSCHTQVCCTQSPCPCGRPLLTHTSTGNTQTLKGRSDSVSMGSPGVHKVLFEPSEHLREIWDLTLNTILPLLPSCWGFSFALGCGVSFFSGIQHFPIDGCSAASCNFRFLTEEQECMSLYSTILIVHGVTKSQTFNDFHFHYQTVKNLSAVQETKFNPWVRKIPWSK